MKPLNFARVAILIAGASLYSIGTAHADTNADIEAVLLNYQQALNQATLRPLWAPSPTSRRSHARAADKRWR